MGDNDLESRADQVCKMEVVCSPSPADETFLSCNHFLLNWFGAVVRGSKRQKPGHAELIEGAMPRMMREGYLDWRRQEERRAQDLALQDCVE